MRTLRTTDTYIFDRPSNQKEAYYKEEEYTDKE